MKAIIVCGVILVALSPVLAGDADKDQKALQGKWEGKLKDKEQVEFTVSGNQWALKSKDKEDHHFKGTFTLNPKAKPHEMNLKVEGGGEKADEFKGKTALAIYEISGDTLRWAVAEPGREDRPSEFAQKDKMIYVEFRRVK